MYFEVDRGGRYVFDGDCGKQVTICGVLEWNDVPRELEHKDELLV